MLLKCVAQNSKILECIDIEQLTINKKTLKILENSCFIFLYLNPFEKFSLMTKIKLNFLQTFMKSHKILEESVIILHKHVN